MSVPTFSVVIPTCHRNDLLSKCLDCLAPEVQTLPSHEYEVIVTDDGSRTTAETMLRDRYPWAKWVKGPRKGPAANRNNGAKYAQGEWLVFTDDDCLPDANWLSAYKAGLAGEARALEGSIHPVGNADRDMAECPVNLQGGLFWSANIVVQRALFEEIKGFDASYPLAAHEDQDLHIRLKALTPISFIPEARVLHPVRIIPLKKAFSSMPKRCAAWAHHVYKHQNALKIRTTFALAQFIYMFHLRTLRRQWIHRHPQSALVSIGMLLIGNPLTLLCFRRLQTTPRTMTGS